jgi:predicted ATP-grasp superfamily ATP-dependent carboligase
VKKIYNILFVEAEYRKVLPIIRQMGRIGHKVYTISLNKYSIGGSSKYVQKNYYFQELTVNKILEIINEKKIDLIIPCNEKSVEFFAKNSETFKIPVVVPNLASFEICQDKLKTIQFAENLGVRVPKTLIFENLEELKKNIAKIDFFPLVLKPRKSSGSRGIVYINNKEDLLKSLNPEYIEKYSFPLIQEYIPNGGKAVGASFLYYNGEEVFGFCHQRIREYPPSGGPSTLAISVYNNNVLSIGRKLLNNLNWSGLAMVEFKEDPRNSELVLMEINPRMWGTIGLALFAGKNFLDSFLKVYLENMKPCEVDKTYNENYYFRWFFPGDLMSILKDKKHNFKEKIQKIFEKHDNVIYQIIDVHDIKPFFSTILYSIFKK